MDNNFYQGLTTQEAERRLAEFGRNELSSQKKETFISKILHILCEPMFILLLIAAVIYFILGEARDGAIMLVFVIAIISIDVIQEWKTDKTLNALKDLSAPHSKVVRDGAESLVLSSTLVPHDLIIIEEGNKIAVDGYVLKSSDLCVDESTLTGEAEGVWKCEYEKGNTSAEYWRKDYVYAGTLVTQGSAYVKVDKTGKNTEYGKIGAGVADAPDKPTPLQKQTGRLVKLCAGIAGLLFALVAVITYLNLSGLAFEDRLIQSVLSGITLAMAMIPEEFPVILTVFLSLGAWRLAKKSSLVRRLPAVETLGAVSVLCVDKTGTLTLNQMTMTEAIAIGVDDKRLHFVLGKACELDAYDPMEKAMLAHCEEDGISRAELTRGKLVKEYAFTNALKMMGHVWATDGETLVCAKGSPERIFELCNLSEQEYGAVNAKVEELAKEGLRVIAVAEQRIEEGKEPPESITDCRLTLCGIVALADPPRPTVKDDIEECIKAHIRVVMITGDNGVTASGIARQVGIPEYEKVVTGTMLDAMSDDELKECVKTVNIFSRVIPEHKMRIVKAFQANGEVVAMTGDGVNDAPALKHADIGIAMGKRGSEVSREAADLVLMDDNFSTIVQTVKDGRRIYKNIKKAIGYVFSIHIPIAIASLLAPLLKVGTTDLMLLPLHIVLLELLIDPTCSIVLERQPAERDIMSDRPRDVKANILTKNLLIKSVLQGLVLFAVSFGVYWTYLQWGMGAELARTMGITVLMLGNLFLVQVNSSDKDFCIVSAKRLLKDKVMWIVNIFTVALLIVVMYTPLNVYLKLAPLSFAQLMTALGLSAGAVLWYELVKLVKFVYNRLKEKKNGAQA